MGHCWSGVSCNFQSWEDGRAWQTDAERAIPRWKFRSCVGSFDLMTHGQNDSGDLTPISIEAIRKKIFRNGCLGLP